MPKIKDKLMADLDKLPRRYLDGATIIGIDPGLKCTAFCNVATFDVVSGPMETMLSGPPPFESQLVLAFVEKIAFNGPKFVTTRAAANRIKKAVKEWWPRHARVIEVDPTTWHMAMLGFAKDRERLKIMSAMVAKNAGYTVKDDNEADAVNIALYGRRMVMMTKKTKIKQGE
jgi:hypothetical protein